MQQKHKTVLIFAFLAGTTLLFFQNCGSSIFMLGTSQQVKAKTDFSEIIKDNDKEINSTKDLVLSKDHEELNLKNAEQADRLVASSEEVQVNTDKNVRIKLIRKPAKVKHK